MATVSTSLRDLRALARTPAAFEAGLRAHAPENGDRVFVTLLALNFMLLAFFVVLGTTASIDRARGHTVSQSVGGATVPTSNTAALLTVRQALQTGIADTFADVLPPDARHTIADRDRVDLAVPADMLMHLDAATLGDTVDKLAALLRGAPAGFHYEMLVSGGAAAAHIVAALMERGVDPQSVLLAVSAADEVRFSFLLHDGERDESVMVRALRRSGP